MPEILPNSHPIVIHFVVALLITSTALFAIGSILARGPAGAAATVAARWNLGLGALAALIGLATGWQAYNSVAHDDASHVNMTIHMKWAFAATGCFVLAAVLAWLDRRRSSGAGLPLGLMLLLGCGTLAVTGWLGAENVYRYGLGVKSLPKPGPHHHDEGDDDHDQGGSHEGEPASSPDKH